MSLLAKAFAAAACAVMIGFAIVALAGIVIPYIALVIIVMAVLGVVEFALKQVRGG